ncbi:MAG: type II secretion system GspH family protein [Gemmataceae bacterium]|jgi:prepilin-type N-terminal cleavage/methylation domain-containing protein|nr:type II secretion system GspH family protein [Gemmataceae bacterium]
MMHRTTPRQGFTLIELLVVIAIIATLIGILLPAVQAARQASFRASASSDIAQLSQAVEQFKATYTVKYLPSGFVATNSYTNGNVQHDDSRTYLKTTWRNTVGPLSGTTYSSTCPNLGTLDGSQCLVFFLGGPGWFTGTPERGLAAGSNPFATGGERKISFDFPAKRVSGGRFLDPWGQPYFYFSSRDGNDYGYFGLYYGNSTGGYNAGTPSNVVPLMDASGKFQNSHGFQIISLGKNRIFDGNSRRDDQYNFAN